MKAPDHKKDFNRMINRYLAGKANAQEILFVEAYYQHLGKEDNPLSQLNEVELADLAENNYENILAKINQSTKTKKIVPFYKYVAAAVLFISFISGFLYLSKESVNITKQKQTSSKHIDVLPGIDKAVLTLADGSKVVLDKSENGNILEKNGLTITKTSDGQLIYKVNVAEVKASIAAYNTIETAKGNQYQLLLPDGTKVWLNASSSLKYPEFFAGNERKVMLTGEAYFEVAKDKQMPFRVQSRNQDVQVLGTHFNINSYADNQTIKTTLIEGKVKVSNANFSKTLIPGQQAVVSAYGLGNIAITNNVDTDDEVAWKNGQFRFNNESLISILNQLERWYDVKIDYQTIPNKRYNGMVPRKAKLSEVLNMLELTGDISFKIEEGKRLIVTSK